MRFIPRALLAGGLGFAVSWLVACGGGAGLLSGNQSSTLNGQLDAVSSAVSSRQCATAARAVARFSNSVTNLPGTVSPTLRANLLQGASTVGALAQRDCQKTTTTQTTTSTTTSTTSTSTSSTTTQPSTSSSTSTTSSSTTSPATSSTTTGTTPTTGGTGGAGIGGGSPGGGSPSGGTGANGGSSG